MDGVVVNFELFKEKLEKLKVNINALIDSYTIIKTDYEKLTSSDMSGSIFEQMVINHAQLLKNLGDNIVSLKNQYDKLLIIYNSYLEDYQDGV